MDQGIKGRDEGGVGGTIVVDQGSGGQREDEGLGGGAGSKEGGGEVNLLKKV